MRWTTGVGILVGGVGGAIAALMGAPKAPTGAPAPRVAPVVISTAAVVESASAPAEVVSAVAATPAASASATAAAASPSVSPPAASAAAPAAVAAPPALELPTTREGLLKAEMLCDQKKDFDECARAAEALEKGTTDVADPEQGKRFRKIALTHLVMQCESGSPHACFVLAAKYRAGTELTASTNSADTLEKRGLELCHKRSAPECPAQ